MYKDRERKNLLFLVHSNRQLILKTTKRRSPETVTFYNETKCGVGITDQMAIKYSVKVYSGRQLVHTFYNIVDLVAINVWIISKKVTGETNISIQYFIQLLVDELHWNYTFAKNKTTRKHCKIPSSD